MQKPNDKNSSEDNKSLFIAKLWKNLHCLSSDPSVRKEWIYFICNEVPDHISNNSVLCLLNFTTDLFTNKAQFDVGFSERLKLKDDAVSAIVDQTVMSQHTSVSNCFYDVVNIALSDNFIWVFMCFNHKSQQRPSVKAVDYQTYTTIIIYYYYYYLYNNYYTQILITAVYVYFRV